MEEIDEILLQALRQVGVTIADGATAGSLESDVLLNATVRAGPSFSNSPPCASSLLSEWRPSFVLHAHRVFAFG